MSAWHLRPGPGPSRAAASRHAAAGAVRAALGAAAAAILLPAGPAAAGLPGSAQKPGFLVLVADRGFLGNEEVRDAFAGFAEARSAALVFVTDDGSPEMLEDAVEGLRRSGARRIVILPLFLSDGHPRLRTALALLGKGHGLLPAGSDAADVSVARPFGESYLAVEARADRLRALDEPAGRRRCPDPRDGRLGCRVVVVDHGALDDGSRRAMQEDLERVVRQAAAGLGFRDVRAAVWPDRSALDRDALEDAVVAEIVGPRRFGSSDDAAADAPVVVLPSHLGRHLDAMMSVSSDLRRALPAAVEVLPGSVTPHPAVGMWLEREARRFEPLPADRTGLLLLAHGSDIRWNETLRRAGDPLRDRWIVEEAFTMADPSVVERAVRRLEVRGARAAVVVRAFGLAESFEAEVEQMLGLDVERCLQEGVGEACASAHSDSHHGHRVAGAPYRIRSALIFATAGGLDDHPLFARALLDRARELSRDPQRETVILVAHGSGDDNRNERWRGILRSLARQMRELGAGFRAIEVGTWREDWPEKRGPEIARIRRLVEQAARDGGRALVIPARTTGRGPEERFLAGLEFELGQGFAPHPLFAHWVEEQVRFGLQRLATAAPPSGR
jgi:sirohydrochlorin ferrochelatase